jgi:hypothetical protein
VAQKASSPYTRGCMQARKKHYVNTKGLAKRPELSGFSPSFRCLWRQYLCAAEWAGRKLEITPDEFADLIKKDCHYCGLPPSNPTKWKTSGGFLYNGIDRVDNSQGYVSGNLVAACKHCNSMKSRMTTGEFLAHVGRISAFQAG